MKLNVFDQNKPRKINSKNNVFASFLQKRGLYDEIEVKRENVFHLIDLINGKVKIDEQSCLSLIPKEITRPSLSPLAL